MDRNRRFFILEGITGMGQFFLTVGAFLAGFVSYLQGSESLNGTLGVVPAATGVFQVFAVLLLRKGKSRKRQVLKLGVVLRLFLACIYFVPFVFMQLGADRQTVLMAFVVMYIMGFVLNGIAAPMVASWMMDVVPIETRGRFFAYREKVSFGIIGIMTIILGLVLDRQKEIGMEMQGFMVVGIVLVVLAFLNIYALMNIEDINHEKTADHEHFWSQLMHPFADRMFKRTVVFYVLWNVALFIGGPFIAVYMVEELELSYTYMMTMNVVGIIVRVMVTGRWGVQADRKSWFWSGKYSLLVLAVTHFLWGFVTIENVWLMVPLLNLISGIAWAGVGISLFNIQFLFFQDDIRTISLGVNAALGGLVSIAAVKVGGAIVNLPETGLHLAGIPISNIQVTFMMSGVLLAGCALYIKLLLENTDVRLSWFEGKRKLKVHGRRH